MNRILRKIFAFLLLLIGSLPLLFTIFFLIKQQVIRHEMKEKLEISLLQTITINENDVVWMDDHEIWVNEHMFDIRTKNLENGIYTFTGLYDEAETLLVKKHKNATEKNSEESRVLSSLFQLLQCTYIEIVANSLVTDLSLTEYRPLILQHITTPFKAILTPPPQSASVII